MKEIMMLRNIGDDLYQCQENRYLYQKDKEGKLSLIGGIGRSVEKDTMEQLHDELSYEINKKLEKAYLFGISKGKEE